MRTESGTSIDTRFVHPSKVLGRIMVSEFESTTDVKLEHPIKAQSHKYVTEFAITTDSRDLQYWNVPLGLPP